MKICYHQKCFLIKTAYQRAEAVQLKHCTTALKSKINNKKRPNLSVDLTSKFLTRLQNNQDNINNKKKTINLKFKNTYQSVY